MRTADYFDEASINSFRTLENNLRGHLDRADWNRILIPLLFLKASFDQQHPFRISAFGGRDWSSVVEEINSSHQVFDYLQKLARDDYALMSIVMQAFERFNEGNILRRLLEELVTLRFSPNPVENAGGFLSLLLELYKSDGRAGMSDFYQTADSINTLLVQLSGASYGDTIHDPFPGLGTTLFMLCSEIDNGVYASGQEINQLAHTYSKLVWILAGWPTENLALGNSITSPAFLTKTGLRKFDLVVSDPPIGHRRWGAEQFNQWDDERFARFGEIGKNHGDLATLVHCIGIAKKRVISTAISGVLFRGDGSSKHFRERVIKDDILESVILLPSNLRLETSIATIVLTFTPDSTQKPKNQTLFIDASELDTGHRRNSSILPEDIDRIATLVKDFRAGKLAPGIVEDRFATIATTEEIINNDYDLSLPHYVDLVIEETLPSLQKLTTQLNQDRKALADSEAAFDDAIQELNKY